MEALICSLESPPSVLSITDTWLNTHDDSKVFLIKGYDQYSVRSRELRGGVVIIQALKGINIVEELPIAIEKASSVKTSHLRFQIAITVI